VNSTIDHGPSTMVHRRSTADRQSGSTPSGRTGAIVRPVPSARSVTGPERADRLGVRDRLSSFFRRLPSTAGRLSRVIAVSPGKEGDGLVRLSPRPFEIERQPEQLTQEFSDALDAWRTNPLARRIVSLITAYVCGDGIMLSSAYGPLQRFLASFWNHPQNDMPTRQRDLCDELTRTGELFVVLHTNPADGMSYVRAISAGAIDKITTAPGDYETELTYHETVPFDDPNYQDGGRTWHSPAGADGRTAGSPVMLHFAINRPIGALRGESDLAPVLNWLRRYNRWLEDRVRLNAAVRAFLWIVKVPAPMVGQKAEQYRHAPDAGNVIVTEAGAEEWEAVTPKLEARDAALDGRAIRWMIAAGGPGISLVDFGEGEDSNLATARAMAEQRQKVMRGRQQLFAHILASIVVTAYNRARDLGRIRGRECTPADLTCSLPDISPADNADLAGAAFDIANAFRTLADAGAGAGPTFTETAIRLLLRFAGESLTEDQIQAIVRETQDAPRSPQAPPGPGAGQNPGRGLGETNARRSRQDLTGPVEAYHEQG
jgi:hypothetical protein